MLVLEAPAIRATEELEDTVVVAPSHSLLLNTTNPHAIDGIGAEGVGELAFVGVVQQDGVGSCAWRERAVVVQAEHA